MKKMKKKRNKKLNKTKTEKKKEDNPRTLCSRHVSKKAIGHGRLKTFFCGEMLDDNKKTKTKNKTKKQQLRAAVENRIIIALHRQINRL